MREDSEDDMYDETQDGGGLWSKYDASTFGGGGGGNSSGYTYNWLTGRYYDASGYVVSYTEVYYNYALPNARTVSEGKDAQVQFKLLAGIPLVAYGIMDMPLLPGVFKVKNNQILNLRGWNSYIAPMDNTRVVPGYYGTGGDPTQKAVRYNQNGGLIILGNSNWQPREKARHVDGRPIDMSYSPPFQYTFAGWFKGLMKPQSNPQNWNDGDTIILNWNYRVAPALTIMNINNVDTTFMPIRDGVTPPYWYKPPTSYDYYKRIK